MAFLRLEMRASHDGSVIRSAIVELKVTVNTTTYSKQQDWATTVWSDGDGAASFVQKPVYNANDNTIYANNAKAIKDFVNTGGVIALTDGGVSPLSTFAASVGMPFNDLSDWGSDWAAIVGNMANNSYMRLINPTSDDYVEWPLGSTSSGTIYYNVNGASGKITVPSPSNLGIGYALFPFAVEQKPKNASISTSVRTWSLYYISNVLYAGLGAVTEFESSNKPPYSVFFYPSSLVGNESLNVIVRNFLLQAEADNPTIPDPNDKGGTSEPGGGTGNFDDTSDPISLPPLPTVSATDCGLVTAFVPSRDNLIALGNYLYSSLLDLDTLKRIFDQPMEHIIGLNILPFTPTTSSTKEITFANFSTGVTNVPYISQQYQEIDCGTLEVKEYWGSALDYSPNTRAYLWLPHIGFVQVDIDIIMGTTCRVVYRVDTVTGTCMAVLIVNGSVINHWTGELALNIPLSSADYSRVIGAILGIAGTAIGVGAAIGGAMKAGEALGAAESTLSGLSTAGASGQAKSMAADALTNAAAQHNEAKGALAVTMAKGAVNTVSDVMGAKLGIQMSGAISGQAGIMDVQKPYFLFIRPNQSLAENYKHYVGYPSNMYASVESCKGFTIFEQIELNNITATDSEIAEISKLLKGGFYG